MYLLLLCRDYYSALILIPELKVPAQRRNIQRARLKVSLRCEQREARERELLHPII